MRCPRCGHLDDRVVDSRQSREGDSIRRRRECLECAHRFTTYEQVEVILPMIVKRDGRREAYQREKLLAGLRRAVQKRPVATETLTAVVERIERGLAADGDREVESRRIGDALIKELRALDGVAWLRFASVYYSFQDISEFLAQAGREAGREDS